MYTFQDLRKISERPKDRAEFVHSIINAHKGTELYKTAVIAEQYAKHKNVTINNYQKVLYKITGEAFPDLWSANYKMACRHFYRFITQENQFLLGNGVHWNDSSTADKLGTKEKDFDTQLQKAGKKALIGGVSFGLFDYDHVEVFAVTEFAPLYDEIDSSLKAGVRFWQIDSSKPLRAKLYEIDGYTDYIYYDDDLKLDDSWIIIENGLAYKEKKSYTVEIQSSEVGGEEVYEGENYPTFPIVPFFANEEKQSELVGLREQIDCFDLIKCSYANNVDEAGLIYWTLSNAGGMDDIDLAKFKEKLLKLKAATVDDDVNLESHTVEAPYASREALLDRLEKDMYKDAMALDTDAIANGAVTATQIKAAYEPLNAKADMYEYCVLQFIQGILKVAGIEDEPSFTRSMIVNTSETIQNVLASASYLPEEYVTEKILTLLGDGDKAEKLITEMQADGLTRIDVE